MIGVITGDTHVVVSSGQTYVVTPGPVPFYIYVSSGGLELIQPGAEAEITYISSGGSALVSGLTDSPTVSNGGTQVLGVSGVAHASLIDAGGIEIVSSGGFSSNPNILPGGHQVIAGGSATATYTYDRQDVMSGGVTNSTTVLVNGVEAVSSGASASHTMVASGGTLNVLSGGLASDTFVSSGGTLQLFGGGVLTGATTIQPSGILEIGSGNSFTGYIVSSGATLEIASGASADNTTVLSGGTLLVRQGGTVTGTTVSNGGSVVSDTIVGNGQTMTVSAGQTSAHVIVSSGGSQAVLSGGFSSDTMIASGGQQTVSAGGSATDTVIGNGGHATFLSGAVISNLVVSSGGFATINSSYADALVSSGGFAQYIGAGPIESPLPGGLVEVTSADMGGSFSWSDLVIGPDANFGIGATASGIEVISTGILSVTGGTTYGTRLFGQNHGVVDFSDAGGGTEILAAGFGNTVSIAPVIGIPGPPSGHSFGTIVGSGGHQIVSASGIASGTLVLGGGRETVSSGGVTSDTTVSSGGILEIFGGGVLAGTTTLASGGTLEIGSGNTLTGYVVSSGRTLEVESGALASNTTVLSGGTLRIDSGGSVWSTTMSNGGAVIGSTGAPTESSGATSLAQVGNNYFLYPVGGSSGPELSYQGSPVTMGQLSPWTILGAEQSGGGYLVAWKYGSADQYSVWTTDSTGAFVAGRISSGSDATLESQETTFQQDLNGDGTIGPPPPPPPTVIEAHGATSLDQAGNNYFMYTVGTSSGPQLSYQGSPVTMGQFSPWTILGAEQSGGGYLVAWKYGSADQYSVWTTDSTGAFVSSRVSSGSDATLENQETIFQQDLNGDGTIGAPPPPPPTVIEAHGATGLDQVGNNYFMYAVGTSSGPELSYQGSPVTMGQFSPWTILGAEQSGGGYLVAWKYGGADQYSVWTTDSSGAFVSSRVSSGSDATLENQETIFQQDLNGDGTIGLPGGGGGGGSPPPPPSPGSGTVIEADGATSLVQVGSNYFLYPVSGSSGPELSYQGNPVTMGQFSPWTILGAEQSGGGYLVAWKYGSADQYSVWTTDSNGAFVSSRISSGSDATLENQETTFQQDLNGDGRIGTPPPPPPTVIESSGATSLDQVGNNYFMYAAGTSSGPELSYQGSPVTMGQFSPWTILGAEQSGGGYLVAWKYGSADQYSIWTTDSSGAFVSSRISSGSDATLENQETIFQQDLNGDGHIGTGSSSGAIQASGTISMALLINYTASTFITPAPNGTSPSEPQTTSIANYLTHPPA